MRQDEERRRLAACAAFLEQKGLDGVYVTGREDVRYLTGYAGGDAAALVAPGRRWLVTDFRYAEEARASAGRCRLVLWKEHPARHAGKLAAKAGFARLGFDARRISVAAFRELKAGAKGVRLMDAGAGLAELRAVKSPYEISAVVKALRIAEAALADVRGGLKPGLQETEIRHRLEEAMRAHGSEGPAFPTIAAAGANASRPHARPGSRQTRAREILLLDFGATAGGYASDITRTFFLGDPGPLWRRRYEWVLMAQAAGLAALTPGRTCREADGAARAVFRAAGAEKLFGHGLGHGVGLAVHEEPRLSKTAKGKLAAGMTVTVEPGLYWPRRGGIRIEDMALVTPAGARILTRCPKSLDYAVLD